MIPSSVLVLSYIDKHQVNHLTPRSDQHESPPDNILTFSRKQLMRIFKLIR